MSVFPKQRSGKRRRIDRIAVWCGVALLILPVVLLHAASFEATFNGALYHFVSQEHREVFEKDPIKYAPAYGGYCGYAASIGKVRPANPMRWSVVDGQLIVQHTKGAVELWDKDVSGNKAKADKNWPLLGEKKAGIRNPVDSLWGKSVLAQVN